MRFDFESLLNLLRRSLSEPDSVARDLVALDLRRDVLWTALALVAVLNVLLMALLQIVSPVPDALEQQGIVLSPFTYTILVGAFLVVFVFSIQSVGRLLGGQGSFSATLVLMIWFQALSLALEVVQVFLVLISPAIGGIFGIVSLGVLLWCMVNFIKVLHGFENKGKAIGTLVLALISTAVGAGLILSIVGVSIPGGTI